MRRKEESASLTQVAVGGAALAGGGGVGVVGVSSIFVQVCGLDRVTGWGQSPTSSSPADLDLGLPLHHIDSGWLVGGARELLCQAASDRYLAAGETQRRHRCL